MKKVEVLISTMHQNNFDVVDSTKIQSDVLVINQCDKKGYVEEIREYGKIRFISTTERGLSKSRNMALKNALGDYCLICDDDEILYDGYSEKIIKAFEENEDADIICFKMDYKNKKYFNNIIHIDYIKSLKISSCEIVFKLESLKKSEIVFDEDFGAGTKIGAGEENILLFDCLKKGLKIIFVPVCLGKVNEGNSTWFKGFTSVFFENKGIIIRRLMGIPLGLLYCGYFAVDKYRRYKKEITFAKAFFYMIKGLVYGYKGRKEV